MKITILNSLKTVVYIGFGSNVGDRAAHLSAAAELLSDTEKTRVTKFSSVWESAPIGKADQDDFLNAAAEVETELNARDLLHCIQDIEQGLDRQRCIKWGPRTIDLDILLFGDQVIHTQDLCVPHAELANRKCVLLPLLELNSQAVHPELHKTIGKVWETAPVHVKNQKVARLKGNGLHA